MDIHEFSYAMSYELGRILGGAVNIFQIVAGLLGLVGYVFGSIALYDMAKRRCIPTPWMAWVPILRTWSFGSFSDQYRYVTKNQVRSKRKVLLVLQIITRLLGAVTWVKFVQVFQNLLQASFHGTESQIVAAVVGGLLGLSGLLLALTVAGILRKVFHYMAAYDVYTSAEPRYGVIFLVVSIFFSFLEPYFLFYLRKKDGGMPPRQHSPQDPIPEPWDL